MILFASLIVLLILLIALSALLSGSETALFSLSHLQLKQNRLSKDKRLNLIAKLMEHPREVLVTILMLNVLANILVQNTVSSLFEGVSGWGLKVGLPLALTLIFGEVLPKSIAMPNNRAIARWTAPFIDCLARLLKPLRHALTWATSWISRVLFLFLKSEEEISADELKHIVKTSRERGVLLEEESRFVEGAIDLQETLVKEHMRPRQEMLYYDTQEPLQTLLHIFIEQRTTRVPVCEGTLENLLGVISMQQFFVAQATIKTGSDLVAHLQKPYYVPETTKAFPLLKTLRERSESLAIVVDEYGSISGLVTQEDLIERVVGEIEDRPGNKSLYTRSGSDVIIASGKLELAEFKDIFGIELPSEESVVTLGGWLTEQLGDIPKVGAQYETEHFSFHVLAADPNRVRRIYVRRLK